MSEFKDDINQALTDAFMRYIGLKPNTIPTPRQIAMLCYSDETKALIIRTIELNPALEESILNIAELAYIDGENSVY
jgi:hypothetical protein